MSWAPTARLEPRAASAAAASEVKGGQRTISQWLARSTSGLNFSKKARVSAAVLNIFQLPAITGRRIRLPPQEMQIPRPESQPRQAFGTRDDRLVNCHGSGNKVYLSVRASTPGSFSPPRNSSEAPPPVEMWVRRAATPALCTAAMESPPPTMEVAPDSAMARATDTVPAAKGSHSKTPMGPFQTMVLAPRIAAMKALMRSEEHTSELH